MQHDAISIIPLHGIGEVRPGDDLVAIIAEALDRQGLALRADDILVVTQKIVSKAEGQLVDPRTYEPSAFAHQIAALGKKDAHHQEVVLRESRRIVRMANGVLITETHHGLICANAGVDESNVDGGEHVTLLPRDPDASARNLRAGFAEAVGVAPAVIISDSFGRAWREGQVNIAIGVAGIAPIAEYGGMDDPHGYRMEASRLAVADELAAAAELVMGKIAKVPVALIRGYAFTRDEQASAQQLIRDPRFDLFR